MSLPLAPHFTAEEIACSHCGELGEWALLVNQVLLEELREHAARVRKYIHAVVGLPEPPEEFPLHVTSGHRCKNHPIEREKTEDGGDPGAHSRLGLDIAVWGWDAFCLSIAGVQLGWWGVGAGQQTFKAPLARILHLDRDGPQPDAPRPWFWSY